MTSSCPIGGVYLLEAIGTRLKISGAPHLETGCICERSYFSEMEVLWSDFDTYDVDQKLEAFMRLKSASSENDLPDLLVLLKSERNDFWTRELLAEPIAELGGVEYLDQLFDALAINFAEGHDNDSFLHFLTEIAWAEPGECKEKLLALISIPDFEHKEQAEWLLQFCEN